MSRLLLLLAAGCACALATPRPATAAEAATIEIAYLPFFRAAVQDQGGTLYMPVSYATYQQDLANLEADLQAAGLEPAFGLIALPEIPTTGELPSAVLRSDKEALAALLASWASESGTQGVLGGWQIVDGSGRRTLGAMLYLPGHILIERPLPAIPPDVAPPDPASEPELSRRARLAATWLLGLVAAALPPSGGGQAFAAEAVPVVQMITLSGSGESKHHLNLLLTTVPAGAAPPPPPPTSRPKPGPAGETLVKPASEPLAPEPTAPPGGATAPPVPVAPSGQQLETGQGTSQQRRASAPPPEEPPAATTPPRETIKLAYVPYFEASGDPSKRVRSDWAEYKAYTQDHQLVSGSLGTTGLEIDVEMQKLPKIPKGNTLARASLKGDKASISDLLAGLAEETRSAGAVGVWQEILADGGRHMVAVLYLPDRIEFLPDLLLSINFERRRLSSTKGEEARAEAFDAAVPAIRRLLGMVVVADSPFGEEPAPPSGTPLGFEPGPGPRRDPGVVE